MNDTPLIIFGASGHAKVIIDIVRKQRQYAITGLVVRDSAEVPERFCDVPIIGTDEDVPDLSARFGVTTAIVALGDNSLRRKIAGQLRDRYPWLKYATAVHPSAQIGEDVSIGQGTVVMAGAVINSGTIIGDFCIVNSSASVDHDNSIEDFASLAPGVVTGGNVIIRHSAAICLGASVIHNREIGRDAVIGSGSVVVTDIPPRTLAYGIPARVIRRREPDDRYL